MLQIIGYADRFSVAPGETIRFMVSAPNGKPCRGRILRLIHGDANPAGPGFKADPVAGVPEHVVTGRRQTIAIGSWGRVPYHAVMDGDLSFTLAVLLWPTLPGAGRQGLLGRWDEAGPYGCLLEIDDRGCLAARFGDAHGSSVQVGSGKPMVARRWYLAAVSYDAGSGTARLVQRPLQVFAGVDDAADVALPVPPPHIAGLPLTLAAVPHGTGVRQTFNGKLEAPRLVAGVVDPARLEALIQWPVPADLRDRIVGAWDLARDTRTTRIVDAGPNDLAGELVNLPTRAMKGARWDGSEHCWWRKPEHYGAVHFHDTDLHDAGWESDFAWTLPDDLRSGVYAAHIACGDAEDGTEEDLIPFFVRPPRGAAGKAGRPKLAYLIPTAAYMAYANDRNHLDSPGAEMVIGRLLAYQPSDLYLQEHLEIGRSLYDSHSDGSGVSVSSRLRPILNLRPKYSSWLGACGSGLWQFNADTHMLDWLESHAGEPFDVITDEDLHAEGIEILRPYRVIVTGTHPEYHSTRMWDAMRAWIDRGGRLMYVAANGWYWRIAFHDTLPGVIEVRRAEDGIRTWEAQPGEYWHAFNGEYGGLWARHGRTPQGLTGIGFIAQGFDICSYYRRSPASYEPTWSWMWDGIDDEIIGDFGLVGGGAAGLELDGVSEKRGTPPNTVVMASSEAHSDLILLVNEEFGVVPPNLTGSQHPEVRADISFYDTPEGGAVWATGSIAWCGSLSWNGYDNNVSRLTLNVLKRFLDPEPFR
jgi:N,N-dimethylformamidase